MLNSEIIIQVCYLIAAIVFILGLKRMSSPTTARLGIVWAGGGMLLATAATFFTPGMGNIELIIIAIVVGGGLAWITAKKVAMTDMPQMIALYNGMGGGAAAAIAAVEMFKVHQLEISVEILAIIGGIIGAISFSGSIIAFGKLQGIIKGSFRFKGQNLVNLLIMLSLILLSITILMDFELMRNPVVAVFIIALIFGIAMTLPIGGADMPVVISLYNALTGLAVGFEGYVLQNYAMIIAGTVVGAAGTLLTQLMAKAMNRSLGNVLFSGFGDQSISIEGDSESQGEMKPIESSDASIMMAFAQKVIIIPGYGMAVAQAQFVVNEMIQILKNKNIEIIFVIHPVAGRMPGHMNVLLAEAKIPYDIVYEMDEVNGDFENIDLSIVIGANDIVNPSALEDPNSPIAGMPVIECWKGTHTIVLKRGMSTGYAGVENPLFFKGNTRMLFGDAKESLSKVL